jgi:hypothetical protein
MSFDIGLVCYNDGKLGTLSKAILRQALMPYAHQDDDGFWRLSFLDGGGGDLDMDNLTNERQFFDFCVTHASGVDIYGAIYQIMRQTHTLLWWSFVEHMVTADVNIVDHLPPDYIEKYGVPPLVRSSADILAEIDRQG